jgi:hypothetical protein
MADFTQDKKYSYVWQSSKFKDLVFSGSNISQFVNDAGYITSSVAISASYALSSSFATNALSASYAPSTPAFPYTGSARITGSLDVTGSIISTQIGVGAAPNGTTPLDIRAQGALSSNTVFRIRNSVDTQNLMSITGDGRVAIGLNAQILGTTNAFRNVVIGGGAKDISTAGVTENTVALGYNAVSNNGGTALGANTQIAGVQGVAVGASAYAGEVSTAIGTNARADGTSLYQSLAIGYGARASALLSGIIAVGQVSYTNALGQTLAFCVDPAGTNSQTMLLTNKANLIFRNSTQLTSGTHWDTTATNTLTIHSGSIPATTISGAFQMYAATGSISNNARPHFRTGNGTIVWFGDESRLFNVTASSIISNGSITVGNITSTPSTENTLNIYPAPAGGTGEGGQILLAASGGLYTSASMLDTWQDYFRILRGTNTGGSNAQLLGLDLQTGNLSIAGAVIPSAWTAGQVIKDTTLSNTEVTISTTTVATSTSDTDFLTYSYTPVSSNSYLVIHYHLASFSFEGGTGNDSYFSRIKVDGNEITYSRQSTVNGNRTGVLFPLTGRYTNSNTTAKSIVVACRRDSADDNITIVNTATSMWLRITEIAI